MSPIARTPVPDESASVRERILVAATDILREEGIQGLSQVQVSRKAEVRQSHLTYYFPKRDDLIEAVAMRFIEGAFGSIGDATAAAAPDELAAVLRQSAAIVAEEGHMRMFTGVIVEADGNPALRAVLVRVTKQLEATLAARIGGEDATERARLIVASIWGLGLYDFVVRPKRRAPITDSLLAWLVGGTRRSRSGK